jgi:cytochrome d ubiquinol oxidase subunit I
MLALIAASWWLRTRGRLFDSRWFLWSCLLASPLGFFAVLAGWATTEVGRQPWTVYGLLRTADSVSPSLTGFDVVLSLVGYGVVYLIMFPAGIALMARIVTNGPAERAMEPEPVESGRPLQPVKALPHLEGNAES